MKISITVERYTTLDDIKVMTVEALTFPEGQKIAAIKAIKGSWGLGLGEAKDFVETVHEARRQVTAQIQRADDARSESFAAMLEESNRLEDLEEEAYHAERAGQTACPEESECGWDHDRNGCHV